MNPMWWLAALCTALALALALVWLKGSRSPSIPSTPATAVDLLQSTVTTAAHASRSAVILPTANPKTLEDSAFKQIFSKLAVAAKSQTDSDFLAGAVVQVGAMLQSTVDATRSAIQRLSAKQTERADQYDALISSLNHVSERYRQYDAETRPFVTGLRRWANGVATNFGSLISEFKKSVMDVEVVAVFLSRVVNESDAAATNTVGREKALNAIQLDIDAVLSRATALDADARADLSGAEPNKAVVFLGAVMEGLADSKADFSSLSSSAFTVISTAIKAQRGYSKEMRQAEDLKTVLRQFVKTIDALQKGVVGVRAVLSQKAKFLADIRADCVVGGDQIRAIAEQCGHSRIAQPSFSALLIADSEVCREHFSEMANKCAGYLKLNEMQIANTAAAHWEQQRALTLGSNATATASPTTASASTAVVPLGGGDSKQIERSG